jgi:uncharacterized protein (TIGR02453 family)
MYNKEQRFDGFSQETLKFLSGLRENNNKEWFETHKQEYQKYLLDPLQNLTMDLSEDMLAIDHLLVVGSKAISRIYRDVRFSGNKSHYKTTMWVTLRRARQDWTDAPAYFFEIAPSSYRYGMGFYSASPGTMRKFREAIDEAPEEFREVTSFFSKQRIFGIEGEKYKKIFDETKPKEIQDWYQRRNLYLVCNRQIDGDFFSVKLVDNLLSGFKMVSPFYHYLLKLNSHELV